MQCFFRKTPAARAHGGTGCCHPARARSAARNAQTAGPSPGPRPAGATTHRRRRGTSEPRGMPRLARPCQNSMGQGWFLRTLLDSRRPESQALGCRGAYCGDCHPALLRVLFRNATAMPGVLTRRWLISPHNAACLPQHRTRADWGQYFTGRLTGRSRFKHLGRACAVFGTRATFCITYAAQRTGNIKHYHGVG